MVDRRVPREDPAAMVRSAEAFQAQQRFTEADEMYRRAADAGNADAMYVLGSKWAKRSTDYEHTHGMELLHRAADAGHRVAIFQLGVEYEARHDPEVALAWYERASDAGHPLGQHYATELQPKLTRWREETAPQLARLKADALGGDPEAMYRYAGQLEALTRHGMALYYYHAAAEAGHPDAADASSTLLARLQRPQDAEQ